MMRQFLRHERGQSLVEMALVTMLLLSLVGGIVDFGSAFHHYIIITNAAREGARQGARIPCQSATLSTFTGSIVQAAINEAAGSGITLAANKIKIAPTSCPVAGGELTVTVELGYTPTFSSIIGVSTFTMRNAVKMVFFGNDQG